MNPRGESLVGSEPAGLPFLAIRLRAWPVHNERAGCGLGRVLAAGRELHPGLERRLPWGQPGHSPDRQGSVDALEMAISQRLPGAGLVAHSDRGSQYASEHYQRLLAGHEITCRMSRRANCWDNAPMESFFASLKTDPEEAARLRGHCRGTGPRDRDRDSLSMGPAGADTMVPGTSGPYGRRTADMPRRSSCTPPRA